MVELIPPITIGLWAWLFTETLSKEGHIFSFVGGWVESLEERAERGIYSNRLEVVLCKWATCSICHGGWVALNFAVWSSVLSDGNPFNLFLYPVIAMTVAKVMSIKY